MRGELNQEYYVIPSSRDDPLSVCGAFEAGTTRECGWAPVSGFESASCTPGQFVTLGCGCPEASCLGDPMLRACPGGLPCDGSTALASADDTCGFCPQLDFVCPESGSFNLLSGSFDPSAPFVCNVSAP